MTTPVLIACVGNVLRGDDGFGVAVASELVDRLPPGADLIETGIGGVSVVQQLMDGYDALIMVDAIDGGAAPGTVFVLQPELPDPSCMSVDEWRRELSSLHLAEPSRILLLARAAGVLPSRVAIVGCQPGRTEDYEPVLSASVQHAIPVAAARIAELATEFVGAGVG